LESLFDKFFSHRDDLKEKFQKFDTKYKLGLINKLAKEKDERRFYSRITEINFGIFFDTIGCSVECDKLYGQMTPDWTIKVNGQHIIAEVLRLNPSESDKQLIDFQEKLAEILNKVSLDAGSTLEIHCEKNKAQFLDVDNCASLIGDWLINKPQVGNALCLFGVVNVIICCYNDNQNVNLVFGPDKIDFDYKRLVSDNSALLKKVRKYDHVIKGNNIPYIICVFLDAHSWFREEDLYQYLYGLSTERLYEKRISHFIGNALYYSSERVMDNVSGILVRRMDQFTYYHNFTSANRLCLENKNCFLSGNILMNNFLLDKKTGSGSLAATA
jgi:hypothetical protein